MDNRTGASLISSSTPAEVRKFHDDYLAQTGRSPGIELSYQLDGPFLDSITYLSGCVLSGHAPCPADEYMPNLGSRDSSVVSKSLETVQASADTVAAFGGNILVLHAGFTVDDYIYTDPIKRADSLAAADIQKNFLLMEQGSICKSEYIQTNQYKTHMRESLNNLRKAADVCSRSGVRLAVENLNPRLTYLYQVPEELVRMTEEVGDLFICVDIAHLWISSLVHDFDFFAGLKRLLETGRVLNIHIHDNESAGGISPQYRDSHGMIGSGNVPIKEALKVILEHSTANLIVETVSSPLENLLCLEEMIRSVMDRPI